MDETDLEKPKNTILNTPILKNNNKIDIDLEIIQSQSLFKLYDESNKFQNFNEIHCVNILLYISIKLHNYKNILI